jgi:hypothetical protein
MTYRRLCWSAITAIRILARHYQQAARVTTTQTFMYVALNTDDDSFINVLKSDYKPTSVSVSGQIPNFPKGVKTSVYQRYGRGDGRPNGP